MKIEIICATRLSENDFWKGSALGISLKRIAFDKRIEPCIVYDNRYGLPRVYNKKILEADDRSMLAFIHDDVWIDDYFFYQRIEEGLANYDIIGVAGNRQRTKNQPAWAFKNADLIWDDRANLSGSVAHGKYPFGKISFYGPSPASCELLDGCFLAAKKSVLTGSECLFDNRFEFHFYDMDFCRTARSKSLKLGTWAICLTHQSGGHFGTDKWKNDYRNYLEKWGE
ncbi:MAG: hypothetical protein HGB36_03395 [Chlorobiaceae bacterium]|nr:hypothetical protein [Chlorobiaceae bacterium]